VSNKKSLQEQQQNILPVVGLYREQRLTINYRPVGLLNWNVTSDGDYLNAFRKLMFIHLLGGLLTDRQARPGAKRCSDAI
jgi:hypothetical protein